MAINVTNFLNETSPFINKIVNGNERDFVYENSFECDVCKYNF